MSTLPRIIWVGLSVVLAAAAVLSFDGLRHLALAVGIWTWLAWLLPVTIDAGAAVSCATWLLGRAPADAARYAGRMTWALLATSIVGNAAQLGMHAHAVEPPWWFASIVGAIAPIVVGTTVHLVVLLVRGGGEVGDNREDDEPEMEIVVEVPEPESANLEIDLAAPGEDARVADDLLASLEADLATTGDDLESRARKLVMAGAGRGKVAKELDLTPYQARQLLERVKPTVNGKAVLR